MSQRVAIIGDGAMATLCAMMLAENGHAVRMWSAFPQAASDLARTRENRRFLPGPRLPATVEVTAEEAAALEGADLAIQAVPTQFVRTWWSRLVEHCPAELPICSTAKGIENRTLLRPSQVVLQVLGDPEPTARAVAVLSGPCIAPQVARHLPATVTVAANQPGFAEQIQTLFHRPYFRVYTNEDLVGVELAGAVKNVVAIAAGVLDGLDAGDNAKAALVTRGLAEITRLGLAMGARRETFAGLAGVGDLMTTCMSREGRNRSFGEAIGRGQTVQQALAATQSVIEGVATTASVVELAARLDVTMPITEAVHSVLFAGRAPRDAITELMTRPLKAEV
jgi:glycerol-3-phosphate dehydrogenase (NAD(P)+)